MRVAVVGAGATGGRVARQLLSSDAVSEVVVRDTDADRLRAVGRSLGERATTQLGEGDDSLDADVAVLAFGPGGHADLAAGLMRRGAAVVSVSDRMADVEELRALDAEARERGVTLVVGAGFSPGLTCVLARHAAARYDEVDEVHVAKVGTGGPVCARQHHRALGGHALDWHDHGWLDRRGGSGRELCWFPDPIGAEDCYRAALPEALLLRPAFPAASRLTARMAANRRDRLTARLPMLRPPHQEGGPGAVRVEVRGRRGTARETTVLGAMDRPAIAAGAVAAVAAVWAGQGRLGRSGATGLAELCDPVPFLHELAERGVRAAVFEGASTVPGGAAGRPPAS